jgi:hypothetical protein
VSTASDLPDRESQPPLPGGQYVRWGTAFYGASAQQIHIHTSVPPAALLRASAAPSSLHSSRLLKVLVRLENLIGRLVVLAEHSHTAVDHLAALFPPGEGPPTSSHHSSSGAPDPDRPRRNA